LNLLPEDEDEIIIEVAHSIDTKAIPWDYVTSEVDAVSQTGQCYTPAWVVENKAINNDEVEQFLGIVRMSEFEVVKQLRKMPAHIFLLDLFKSSEKHKNALLKVLNEMHVPETIGDSQ